MFLLLLFIIINECYGNRETLLCVIITKEFGDISELCCDGVEVVMNLVYLPMAEANLLRSTALELLLLMSDWYYCEA